MIRGKLDALFVKYGPDYPDAPPSTTTVTITTKGANGAAPSLTLLTLDSNNTDGWYFPRAAIHDSTGAEIADLYDTMPIYDVVNIAIEDADEGSNVDVWFLVSD